MKYVLQVFWPIHIKQVLSQAGWERVPAEVGGNTLLACACRFCEALWKGVWNSFASLFHLKWVPAGARRPQNQRPGGQVQPQTEFPSIFDPILRGRGEPGESLGDPFEQPWAPPGHRRRHF